MDILEGWIEGKAGTEGMKHPRSIESKAHANVGRKVPQNWRSQGEAQIEGKARDWAPGQGYEEVSPSLENLLKIETMQSGV